MTGFKSPLKDIPFWRRVYARGMLREGAVLHPCPKCGKTAPFYYHAASGGFGGHCQACGEWVQETLCSYCRKNIDERIRRGEVKITYSGVAGNDPTATYGMGVWCDQKCHDAWARERGIPTIDEYYKVGKREGIYLTRESAQGDKVG